MTYNELVHVLVKTSKIFKLTVQELSEVVGYSSSTVGNWMSGEKEPTARQFIDWANALGYEVKLTRRKDGTAPDV